MTGRGNAPWPSVKLGDIGESLIGLTYSPDDVARTGTLVLRSSNIKDNRLVFEDNVYVDMPIPERIRVREGDILICVRNGSRRLIGKGAMLDRRVEGETFGAFMAVFRSHANEFLHFAFQTNEFKRQIDAHLGATINQITNASLNGFVVPLPDGPDRAEVVARLTDIDHMITATDRLIAKKQSIKTGIMQQLLTGRTRLPGFSTPWEAKRIEQVLAPRTERYLGEGTAEVLSCTKHFGFVRSLDFFRNQVFSRDLSGYRVIRRGDIGYPANHIEEGSIGVQDLEDTAIVSPIYVVMKPIAEIDTFFLQRQLKLDSYRQQFSRITNASVNRRGSLRWPAFSKVEVDVPGIAEQQAISQAIRDAEAEIDALLKRREQAIALKRGMVQQLISRHDASSLDREVA